MSEQRLMQKKAVVYGLFFGTISLLVAIIALYWIAGTEAMPVIMASPFLLYFIIPVSLAIFFTLKLRTYVGGFWTMREATSGIFVMFITAYFLYSLGNFVYSRAIDKKITERVEQNIVKVTTNFISKQNIPTEQLDEQMEALKENIEAGKHPSAGHVIQQIFFSIILTFVVALIFAAIFKKEPPVFADSNVKY